MVDTNALKERIIESGMSVVSISKKTGMLRETFYNRIKSGDFKISEMCALTKVLNLSQSERDAIFFAKECEHNSTTSAAKQGGEKDGRESCAMQK